MKRLFNTGYYLVLSAVGLMGLLFVATLLPIPGNYKVKVVKSGSMEPSIPVGGIVVIKPSSSYGVGDVITFGADTKTQIPTTHRIVESTGEGANQLFTTKGDANDTVDPTPTRVGDVHGRVVVSAPYIGYLLAFARTPLGFGLLVGVPALLIVIEEALVIVRELVRLRRRRSRKVAQAQTPQVQPTTSPPISIEGIRAPRRHLGVTHIAGGALGVVLVLGLVALPRLGDTSAYYASGEVSKENKFQASASYPVVETALDVGAPQALVVEVPETPEADTPPVVISDEPLVIVEAPEPLTNDVPQESTQSTEPSPPAPEPPVSEPQSP